MYSLPCLCSMPCLCAQIYVGCYAMCYFSPFSTLISLFLVFCLTSNHIQTSHKRDECNHTSKWPQRLTSISPWRAQGMAKPRFRKANMDTKHRSKQAYTCIKEIIQTLWCRPRPQDLDPHPTKRAKTQEKGITRDKSALKAHGIATNM